VVTAAILGVLPALLLVPAPASADHGYQTYAFKNKIPKRYDEKVKGVFLFFDKELSHVEEHSWERAKCQVVHKTVDCRNGKTKRRDEGFTISVATPPPSGGAGYDEAELTHWKWMGFKEGEGGRLYTTCIKRIGCKYFGVTSPAGRR
jgi:hypothetical protein